MILCVFFPFLNWLWVFMLNKILETHICMDVTIPLMELNRLSLSPELRTSITVFR